jgi:hypothetical protein
MSVAQLPGRHYCAISFSYEVGKGNWPRALWTFRPLPVLRSFSAPNSDLLSSVVDITAEGLEATAKQRAHGGSQQ